MKNWSWLPLLLKVHVHAEGATSRAGGTAIMLLCCTAAAAAHAVRALLSDGAAVKSSHSAKHMFHNYDKSS